MAVSETRSCVGHKRLDRRRSGKEFHRRQRRKRSSEGGTRTPTASRASPDKVGGTSTNCHERDEAREELHRVRRNAEKGVEVYYCRHVARAECRPPGAVGRQTGGLSDGGGEAGGLAGRLGSTRFYSQPVASPCRNRNQTPSPTSNAPRARPLCRPNGASLSRSTTRVSARIHQRFITPPTKSSSINAQQQPRHCRPWAAPRRRAPDTPGGI